MPSEGCQHTSHCLTLFWQVSGSSALADSLTREARDRQRRQRAREQLLRLNRKKREEKVSGH